MDDIETEKLEQEIDRLIKEKSENAAPELKKEIENLKTEINDYKVQETKEKVLKILKDGYEAGEYSKKEYEKMTKEPGDQD